MNTIALTNKKVKGNKKAVSFAERIASYFAEYRTEIISGCLNANGNTSVYAMYKTLKK